MRTNQYLNDKLNEIWQEFFIDVPRDNKVIIKFGRKAAKRLGSIRKINSSSKEIFDTQILINGHFRNKQIPNFIIEATIAHELCHYAHGFSSPLPQLLRFPHRGDVVDQELKKRGLKKLEQTENKWLNKHWCKFIKGDCPTVSEREFLLDCETQVK